jgi:hypothetical protein
MHLLAEAAACAPYQHPPTAAGALSYGPTHNGSGANARGFLDTLSSVATQCHDMGTCTANLERYETHCMQKRETH